MSCNRHLKTCNICVNICIERKSVSLSGLPVNLLVAQAVCVRPILRNCQSSLHAFPHEEMGASELTPSCVESSKTMTQTFHLMPVEQEHHPHITGARKGTMEWEESESSAPHFV